MKVGEVYSTEESGTVEEITRFWRHVFDDGRGLLHVWSAKRDANGKIDQETIEPANFNFPQVAREAAKWSLAKAEEGREVYFCAHLLSRPRRIKDNAAPVRTLWGDLDGAPLPNSDLKPTAVVESSAGRFHAYWRLDSEIPPKTAEELNKRIARKIGADPSGFDLSQLLRVPGTVNRKYGAGTPVELVELNSKSSYSAAELDAALPKLERPTHEPGQGAEDAHEEPPVKLPPWALKFWRGEDYARDSTGNLDRSRSLYKIAALLYEHGAARRVIIEALAERDASLGWHKFTQREDRGLRYAEIAQRLEADASDHDKNTPKTYSQKSQNSQKEEQEGFSANIANIANGETDENTWEPPVPFYEHGLPAFPTDALPSWAADFVRAEAETTQTPKDLAGCLVLAVSAMALAKVVEIEPWPGWREPVNLYAAVAMPPGSRKSIVFKHVTRPVSDHEAEIGKEAAVEIAESETRREIYEQRARKSQQAAAKAAGDQLDDLVDDAMKATRELQAINVPAEPKLLADDASPESLATLLRDQGGRMALMSPEGDVFDIMAGRYTQGVPNLGVYLKGHAGDPLRVDRVGRGAERVNAPALTIGLAVQPDVLHGLMDRPGFRGRGLLGRFLYSLPPSNLGSRKTEEPAPVPHDTLAAYRWSVKALLQLAPKYAPGEEIEPTILRLSDDAKAALKGFMAWIEPQLAPGAELGTMTDWAGKLAGAAVRIAGVLYVMDLAGRASVHAPLQVPKGGEIPAQTLRQAIRLADYFTAHARAAFAEMGADPVVEAAKHILRWIERKDVSEFTKREAFEGTKGYFHKVSAMEPGLGLLASHGHIRKQEALEETKKRGRPSVRYEVNPEAGTKITRMRYSQYSQYAQKP